MGKAALPGSPLRPDDEPRPEDAYGRAKLASERAAAAAMLCTRRRLRLFVVGASALYIGLNAVAQLLGVARSAPEAASLAGAGGLLAIAAIVAWSLLGVGRSQSLFAPMVEAAPRINPRGRLCPAIGSVVAWKRGANHPTMPAYAAFMRSRSHLAFPGHLGKRYTSRGE